MFCYQCQETAACRGCTVKGVCGKTPEVAALQDELLYLTKLLSMICIKSNQKKEVKTEVSRFISKSLFMTITNANFDAERLRIQVENAKKLMKRLKTISMMRIRSNEIGVLASDNEDIRSLRELLIYGVKGMSAYAHHAANLGFEDENIYDFIQQVLYATLQDLSADELLGLVLKCGDFGVKTMALIDKANTSAYGNPEITKVNIGVRKNPSILISGHDLSDLYQLLEQSKDSGVDVYTHCEMLPAHYYPTFKKYSHFVGNYGSSWWHQNEDFETFNGVILFTTNCIIPPKSTSTYTSRVYTTGAAGFTGFRHIEKDENGKKDFSSLIAHAKILPSPTEIETGEIIGGFAHEQVFALADKVVDAVKSGAIKKFIVMAGCDGRHKTRQYYSDFAENLPKDTIILTAGCAKYRYNKLSLGDTGGIPRILDAGQCNDSYSLALIALKLQQVFGLEDINQLPIVYNIAWYEQKAVIVLLALLSLGVKKIHLGPTLPAFLSPNVAKILVEKFEIGTISDFENDLKTML
jgi:hydroxylamine reductase